MSGPRVFGLPHLSEDAVAAFADGVLSTAAASRARRHCAECAECADAVRGQREAAMMLRAAQAPPLPSGLLDRLAGLPMSAPLPPPRGGLPTVLGADGNPVFVAHDVHKASEAGPPKPPEPPAQAQTRHTHRRAALPVTVLASAAAVVAAGTFGGHVSTLAAAANRQAPSGAANAAGSLAGGQGSVLGPGSQLAGAGALLPAGRPSAGAGTVTDPAARTALASGGQGVMSVTLAPLRRPAQQPGTAAKADSTSWDALMAGQSSGGGSSASVRLTDRWNPGGFVTPRTGAPIATP